MLRAVLVSAALWCATAHAGDPAACGEAFAECKEDCTMAFGTSMADATRKKLGRCLDTCATTDTDCRDRIDELVANHLDDSATTTRSVATPDPSTAQRAKKADDSSGKRAQRETDERLDDTQREAPKEKRARADQPAPARTELREDEVPKSTRNEVKAVEKKPEVQPSPAPARAEAEKPAPREEKPQPAAPEKKKTEAKPRALDEWDPSAL